MRLWVDEDLSPTLVRTCTESGYEATSVRDRGLLGAKDHELAEVLFEGDWVLITNNAGDFLDLAEERGLHPGLVFIEEGSAAQEREWLAGALAYIEGLSSTAGQEPAAAMINHVVEVDADGNCVDYPWPV